MDGIVGDMVEVEQDLFNLFFNIEELVFSLFDVEFRDFPDGFLA